MSCLLNEKLKAKPILINELVHALTNRKGPFVDGLIPTSEYFKPTEQEWIWNSLREGLHLDRETTDYYILLALSILEAHPDVFDLFHNKILNFSISDVSKYRTKMEGGAFFTSGNRVGKVTPYSDYFPMVHKYKLRYEDSERLSIETDIGRKFLTTYKVSDKGGGSALLCEWPERIPFEGSVISKYPWMEGSVITIDYIPITIDYDKWAEYIEDKLILGNVLGPIGLHTTYLLATSGAEKIAILIMGLALQNTSMEVSASYGQ